MQRRDRKGQDERGFMTRGHRGKNAIILRRKHGKTNKMEKN